jgi:hypothetical protein
MREAKLRVKITRIFGSLKVYLNGAQVSKFQKFKALISTEKHQADSFHDKNQPRLL